MASASPAEDPRSIVTPDAFKVSGDLLGLPLASPRRRLVAILLDLLLIAILSQLGGTALAITAVLFFFLLARRGKGSRPSRGGRILVGCLGVLVVVVAVPAVIGIVALIRGDGIRFTPPTPDSPGTSASPAALLQGVGDVILLRQATSPAVALERAGGVAERALELDVSDAELEEFLLEMLPDSGWSPGVVAQVMAGLGAGGVPGESPQQPGTGGGAGQPGTVQAGTVQAGTVQAETVQTAAVQPGTVQAETVQAAAGQTGTGQAETVQTAAGGGPGATSQVQEAGGGPIATSPAILAARWAELRQEGDTAGADREEWLSLNRELLALTGSDSLATLQEAVGSLERRNEQLSDRVGTLREELDAEREQEGFFLPFLTGIFEDLGLAFGFGTIYLTVFTAWWKGQTPGKRLLGVRVMRLDGKAITWWDAFERAGGYAAGFATGLLGFAQVLWDPNRQAIHDRVSSTVVIRAGAPRVPGRWATAEDVDPGRDVKYEFRKGEES